MIFVNLRLRSLLSAGVLLCGAVVVRGQQTGETAASSTSSMQQSSGGSTAGGGWNHVDAAKVHATNADHFFDATEGIDTLCEIDWEDKEEDR